MNIKESISKLEELGACKEAIKQARNYKTSQEYWADCKRGDWMNWLIAKLSGEAGSDRRKKLVLCLVKQARLAWKYIEEEHKEVVKNCYETAEQWARNENNVTLDDVRAAAAAAAYALAAYAAAAAAADAAAAAAYAVAAYAVAADAAAAAAYAAAAYAAAADARTKILSQCADIVREDYPEVDELWAIKGRKQK